jgi:hypothetical protein
VVRLASALVHTSSMGAQIRAALPLQSLRVLEAIAGFEHTRVLSRLHPQTLARLRAVARLEWLPLEIDLELGNAVADVLGPDVDRERARLCVLHAFETPLLRPFLHGADMLFGLSPAGLIATLPRGWPAVYRDAGSLRYEVDGGLRRVLIYQDVPAEIIGSRLYLESLTGALESIFELCKVEGTVSLGSIDTAARRAELCFEWS